MGRHVRSGSLTSLEELPCAELAYFVRRMRDTLLKQNRKHNGKHRLGLCGWRVRTVDETRNDRPQSPPGGTGSLANRLLDVVEHTQQTNHELTKLELHLGMRTARKQVGECKAARLARPPQAIDDALAQMSKHGDKLLIQRTFWVTYKCLPYLPHSCTDPWVGIKLVTIERRHELVEVFLQPAARLLSKREGHAFARVPNR
mmetsp:Transcript_35005/g.57917  ORF Transcript_35005/g.57917 Transcript_35005/m.57917 type:complete len:201 (+) Transcript_35005:1093-1695(+)